MAERTPEWKLMGWDTNPPALIDIRNDLGEKHNVAAQHPEVVKDLSARFAAWFSRQAKPMFYSETQWRKFNEVKWCRQSSRPPVKQPDDCVAG